MTPDCIVLFKSESPRAKLPTQAYEGDACFDVFPILSGALLPGATVEVDLGFSTAIPVGWEATIRTRSSQGCRGDVQVHPGTIDAGYRGLWSVKLYNHGSETYWFTPDKAVAQVAIRKVPVVHWELSETLPESARGTKGFGSSDSK